MSSSGHRSDRTSIGGIPQLARRVLRGYVRALCNAAQLVILLGLIASVSLAISFPLWYLAVHFRRAYSIGVSVFFGLLVLSYAVYRLREQIRESGTFFGERLIRVLKGGAAAVLMISLLYGIIWLFARGLYLLALPGLCLYLLIVGVLRYGRKRAPRAD